MRIFENLEPKLVWKHFEEILKIPHTSRNEEGVATYITNFAKSLKLTVSRDKVGNVLVTEKGTKGYENAPYLILQGHMDMVGVAAEGVKHDFMKDPIQPKIEGDFVRAKGTTLGADNGIGVAIMLAIMEDESIIHPPLEYLFTVNEESGMDGAHGLEPSFVKGRRLINLDTEEFGQIYISCAGGGDSIINIETSRAPAYKNQATFLLKIKGLKGGHSGVDINLGRGSGNKIAARLLLRALEVAPLRIRKIEGGNKRNSISDHADILLDIPKSNVEDFKSAINNMTQIIKDELAKTDPELVVEIKEEISNDDIEPMTLEATKNLIHLLVALPHGVLAMSPEVLGLVETSTNMGTIRTTETGVEIVHLNRSAVNSSIDYVKDMIRCIANSFGAKVTQPRGYPGWKPNKDSNLLKAGISVFKEMYHKEPLIKAIHAGLECGIFSEKLPGVDMISIGPDMAHVHSPAEELNILSVGKFYNYLKELLKSLTV